MLPMLVRYNTKIVSLKGRVRHLGGRNVHRLWQRRSIRQEIPEGNVGDRRHDRYLMERFLLVKVQGYQLGRTPR